jgi:hypothetical protein
MLIYNPTSLTFKASIIDSAEVKLVQYTHETGTQVLMATLMQPPGKVFFTIDEVYLQRFIEDKLSLQLLFESSSTHFVTVLDEDEYKLYMRSDADIQLCGGPKLFSEFEKNNTDNAMQASIHF